MPSVDINCDKEVDFSPLNTRGYLNPEQLTARVSTCERAHATGPPSRRRKRADAAASEGACRGVRGAKPLG
jgi:hypothetical protein